MTRPDEADPWKVLREHGGELLIEDVPLDELLLQHPTPLIAYSARRLRQNAGALRDVLPTGSRLMFSYKACYLPGVLRTLHDEGIDAEVCSAREHLLARGVRVPASRVAWNAVAMTQGELDQALDGRTAWLGINTIDDLRRVQAAAARRGQTVEIVLRVHPTGIESAYLERGTRLGLDVEDGTAMAAVRIALQSPQLSLRGFHSHTQVHQSAPDRLMDSLRSLIGFAEAVNRATGYQAQTIGLGGGLEDRQVMISSGYSLQDWGSALHAASTRTPWPIEIVLEPGRYFVSDAALGFTRIISRTVAAGRTWWIVDLGTQVLVPFGGREFEVAAVRPGGDGSVLVSIGDRLSSYSGVIKRDAVLPADPADGLLVVCGVGAYTMSAMQQFMYGAPEMVLIEGRRVDVQQRAEQDSAWVSRLLAE